MAEADHDLGSRCPELGRLRGGEGKMDELHRRSLAFGGRAEDCGNVVVTLNIRLLRKVKVAAVSLALASKRVFQVVLCIRSFECGHWCLPLDHSLGLRSCLGRQRARIRLILLAR